MANRQDDLLRTDAYGFIVDQLRPVRYHIAAADAVAADPDGLLDGTALPAAAGTVKIFLAQMPYPMNITMVCSATQTGKAKVHGTNIAGEVISEEFTLNSATPVVGVKAFATVTSIDLPQKAGTETIDVGWGGKFAIPYKLEADELVFVKLFNGSADTGTVTVDAEDLSKNVFDPNGTPDGEKAIDLYILV